MTIVAVNRVRIPHKSTIGYGYGTDTETGDSIVFAGDWQEMRNIAEATLDRDEDEPIEVEVESYQILERHRVPA